MKIRTKKCISFMLIFTMIFEIFICQSALYATNANDEAVATATSQLESAKKDVYNANTHGRAEKEMAEAKREIANGESELGGATNENGGSTDSLSKLASFAAKAQQVILKIGEIVTKIGEILKKVGKALKIAGKILQVAAKVPWLAWLEPVGQALEKIGKVIYQIGNVMVKVGKCITAVGELTKGKDANFGKIIAGIKEAVSTGWTEGAAEYDAIDTSSYEQKASDIITKGQEAWGKVSDFFGGQSGQDDGM